MMEEPQNSPVMPVLTPQPQEGILTQNSPPETGNTQPTTRNFTLEASVAETESWIRRHTGSGPGSLTVDANVDLNVCETRSIDSWQSQQADNEVNSILCRPKPSMPDPFYHAPSSRQSAFSRQSKRSASSRYSHRSDDPLITLMTKMMNDNKAELERRECQKQAEIERLQNVAEKTNAAGKIYESVRGRKSLFE